MRHILDSVADMPLSAETNRRTFFVAAALSPFVVAGCQTETGSKPDVRRRVGVWSSEEVQRVALAMQQDPQFDDVAFAGTILLGNQRGGKDVSKASRLFTYEPIEIATAEYINTGLSKFGALGGVHLDPSKNRASVPLVKKLGEREVRVTQVDGPTSIRFRRIYINDSAMRGKSDFLYQFLIAKEMMHIKAADILTDQLVESTYQGYILPPDMKLLNAVRLGLLEGKIGEIPGSTVLDIWGHILMIPNYNLAIEQENFTEEDLSYLAFFKALADYFEGNGVLRKNQDGTYGWQGDAKPWFEATRWLYNAMS